MATESSTKDKREAWRSTFERLDEDCSGTLAPPELKRLLSMVGQPCDDAALAKYMDAIGLDSSASVTYDQFVAMAEKASTTVTRSQLRGIFAALDIDCSGYLTAAEMRHFLTQVDIHLEDDDMSELISMYDLDGNGQLTIDEFEHTIKQCGVAIVEDEEEEIQEPEPPATTESTTHEDEVTASLGSVSDEALREALGSFDKTGKGSVSIADIREAASLLSAHRAGTAGHLHWSENRELRGLGSVMRKVNHIDHCI